MPRVVVDVTQLVHWPGELTGIPRVMDEIARRFAADATPTQEPVFVSWVSGQQAMARVDLDRFHREGGVHYVQPHHGAPWWSERLAGGLDRAMRVPVPAVRRQLERLRNRLGPERLGGVIEYCLEPGDVLLIGWGEWWDPNFIRFVTDATASGVKVAQLVHDLGPVTHPHLAGNSSSFLDYFSEVLPQAAALVAVSNNTADDLRRWGASLGHADLPIEVVREGDVFGRAEPREPELPASTSDGFVLCVGTIEAKKNHALLYYVYKQAERRNLALPPVVIVGRRGWRTDDVYGLMTDDPEVSPKFVFLHDATDGELAWLYDHCRYTVFPSFFEGWGIPIAESVSRGVPCLCSNAASMPEIAPGAVRHFNPDAPAELLNLMVELNGEEALALARREAATYEPTSWDHTYAEIKRIVSSV